MLALGFSACSDSGAGALRSTPPLSAPSGYERLNLSVQRGDANSDDSPLTLHRTQLISLGDTGTAPERIQDVLVLGDTIYVLDDFAKRVRVFDRRGHALFAFGHAGHGLDEFADPFALALSGNRMLVLNMRRTKPVQIWDHAGLFRGTHSFLTPSSPTTVVTLGDTLVVSTLSAMKVDGTEFLAISADSTGTILGHGCLRDPRYDASAARGGILPLFSATSLSTDGRRIYCTQPVSAVVQVLDIRGNLKGVIRRTPPFYKPPGDAPNSMNPKAIYGFESTWTGLTKFFPRPHGFVSLFTTADSTRELYKLFACDSSSGSVRCFAGDSPGRLVGVLPGDTLMILENPEKGSAVPKIGYYVRWK